MNERAYEQAYQLFLERLRKARRDKKLTQREAASLLNKDQYWLSRSETGQRRVDIVELIAIAYLYEKDLSYFTENLFTHDRSE